MRVSIGGYNLEDFISLSKVKDENISLSKAIISLVKAICNSCSSGLIDYLHSIEASNGTGILGGLKLRVIEMSRHGNNCILHR